MEIVNDTVIADAEAEFGPSLHALVREPLQALPQVPKFCLDAFLEVGRQP
jgi:hypothetical protein